VQADLLPSTPGGALPDWSMNLLRMNRVPGPGQETFAACGGPRVAHPSGRVCGAPPPEWCVHADCSPLDSGGTSVHWSIQQGTLFRRPCSGLQNVLLVVAPVWPTLLVGSVGHPLRNGACTRIGARLFLADPPFIGPSSNGHCFGGPGRACKMCLW